MLGFGFSNAHKWCICSVLYHVYEKLWNFILRVQEVQDVGLMLALNWEWAFKLLVFWFFMSNK